MQDPPVTPPVELLRLNGWILVLGTFGLVALGINLLLPIPDIDDFGPLALMCVMIERHGLRYCVNDNWGFALVLLCFALTKVTGGLLSAQRMIGAAAGLASVVGAELVMRDVVGLRSRRVRLLALLALIVNGWMLELLVSVHLDVVPAALALWSFWLIGKSKMRWHFLGGALVAMGYWFRFHVIALAVFYPLLVLQSGPKRRGNSLAAAAGVALSVAISCCVCYAATGALMVSNQTAIIAANIPSFNWSTDYQLALQKETLGSVVWQVNWLKVTVGRMLEALDRPAFALLIFILLLEAGAAYRHRNMSDARRNEVRHDSGLRQALLIGIAVLAAFAPLLLIRGLTLRFEATISLLLLPVCAAFGLKHRGFHAGILAACLLLCIGGVPGRLYDYYRLAARMRQLDAAVSKAISDDVLRNHPEQVLCMIDNFGNRHNPWWLWNPLMGGGWPMRTSWLRTEFGILRPADAGRLHHPGTYRYVVFERAAENGLTFAPEVSISPLGQTAMLATFPLEAGVPAHIHPLPSTGAPQRSR